MLTKSDLLEALKPLYQKLEEVEVKLRRLDTEQKLISLNLRSQRMQLETFKEIMEEHDKNMEKKFEQQSISTAGFFHETWTALDKLEQKTEDKFQKVETKIGLLQT